MVTGYNFYLITLTNNNVVSAYRRIRKEIQEIKNCIKQIPKEITIKNVLNLP